MTNASFAVTESSQVSAARRAAVSLAERLGFDQARAGRVALATTELATNLAKHAHAGEILLCEVDSAPPRRAIDILAVDRGPGLRSVEEALRDGYSTAGSLGHGLGAVNRQTDEFEMFSRLGEGTLVRARIWDRTREASRAPQLTIAGVSVPKAGESACGDAWRVHLAPQQSAVLVVDGSGHGPLAAAAADEAIRFFDRHVGASPADLLQDLHLALRPTRGAAVACAVIDHDQGKVHYAGLGNIAGAIVAPDLQRIGMASMPGVAGHIMRRVQQFEYPFIRGAHMVLHSDGLSEQWKLSREHPIWTQTPGIIAALLYRDHKRSRDDVTVVVVKSEH